LIILFPTIVPVPLHLEALPEFPEEHEYELVLVFEIGRL
jgi:hypothetical protein